MTDILAMSREAFLAEVKGRVPRRWADVDFAGILGQIITWSMGHRRSLEVQPPGEQFTVSFGLKNTGHVLWAAYPRAEDGAKFVVLPRLFPLLADAKRTTILNAVSNVSPNMQIRPDALLQVPFYTLGTDSPMAGFLELLGKALVIARTHKPAAA